MATLRGHNNDYKFGAHINTIRWLPQQISGTFMNVIDSYIYITRLIHRGPMDFGYAEYVYELVSGSAAV